MAYTTINKATDNFNTVLYTGDGTSSNAITGVGFAPDFLWSKARNGANAHILVDSVRGATKVLHSSATTAEQTCNANQDMISLDSDGFTVGTPTQFLGTNTNGTTVASWNWKAGGTAVSNTDGTITSSVSANTTSGFSIVSYTGTGVAATVGHGLGVTPKMVITKSRSTATNWPVYHASYTSGAGALDESTAFSGSFSDYWNTNPTSSVVNIGTTNGANKSGDNIIMYAFADVQGYSKFGSYTGNGNADGTFVYTGFKPAYVMLKVTSANNNWIEFDNKRSSFNLMDDFISPDINDAETTGNANNRIDMLSNGFKMRGSGSAVNISGGTFIYMAFAEAPIVGTNNIPATAR